MAPIHRNAAIAVTFVGATVLLLVTLITTEGSVTSAVIIRSAIGICGIGFMLAAVLYLLDGYYDQAGGHAIAAGGFGAIAIGGEGTVVWAGVACMVVGGGILVYSGMTGRNQMTA